MFTPRGLALPQLTPTHWAEGITIDRYVLHGEVPCERGVARWRATDRDTGEPVELLTLRTPAAVNEDTRQRFRRSHQALSRLSRQGLVRTLRVFEHEGCSVAVRSPLADEAMGAIRGPIPPELTAAVGAALFSAVHESGETANASLMPDDLGIDVVGRPVFAPRCRPVPGVGPHLTRWVAPEAFDGSAPDGAAALYGLGACLYTLCTGSPPVGRPPPPPSTLRAGLPAALDEAILCLLSVDPAERPGARPLLQSLAAPTIDLRPFVTKKTPVTSKHLETGTVQFTTGDPHQAVARRDGREDAPFQGCVVLDNLADLTPEQSSIAAGHAGVPLQVLDDLKARQLPLVFETFPSVRAAQHRARELERLTDLEVAAVGGSRWIQLAAGLSLIAASTLPAAAAGIAWLVIGAAASALPALLAGLFWLLGAALLLRWGMSGSRAGPARQTWEILRAGLQLREQAGTARVFSRIAALRRQLAGVDLPGSAGSDLRSALKEIEAQLEAVGRIAETANRTLANVDLAGLETRLAALNARVSTHPETIPERDRVARTVADLHGVTQRKASLAVDIDKIDSALDEVASVLGQLEQRVDDTALEHLVSSTRLVREAVAQADEEAAGLHSVALQQQ